MIRVILTLLLAVFGPAFQAGEIVETHGAWECLCGHSVCEWCSLSDAEQWNEFHADAYDEYAAEFTALFDSYEVKHAKNGAIMIRRGNSGSFRFARKLDGYGTRYPSAKLNIGTTPATAFRLDQI